MKYIALLRGINVGGKGILKMMELKKAVEESGFSNVSTFIQSGNVLLESSIQSPEKIESQLEKIIITKFAIASQVIALSYKQLKKILDDVPVEWKKKDDIRKYIAYVKKNMTPKEVIQSIKLKEDIDFVKQGEEVVYMTTKLSGLTKSGFNKIVGTKVYRYLTIRNYNTSQKLLTLMS